MHPKLLKPESRIRIAIVALTLVFLSAVVVAPVFFSTDAQKLRGAGLTARTNSHDESLPNYDIRTDKSANKKLVAFRNRTGRTAADVADVREGFVEGEQALRSRIRELKVEYGPHSRTPEVIGVDVAHGKNALAQLSGSRADTLKQFIGHNGSLFGLRADQAAQLAVIADYQNPEGNMSFVRLKQEINGVPVFEGEVSAGFGKNGNLVRVINNLPAGANEDVSSSFGDPADALSIASTQLGANIEHKDGNSAREKNGQFVFGDGDFAPTAEKVYFPVEPGVLIPSWLVLIWQPVNAFYQVVDVESGSILWRKNITEDQTQSASYNIWANPNAMVNVADNPFPRTPGPTSPDGTQASALARTLVTLVGNEAPYTFNTNGWISDGVNITDGNAVEAGLDRDGSGIQASNGVDTNGIPSGNPSRVFDYPINPGVPVLNGAPTSGDNPLQPGVNPTPCFSAGMSPAMTDYQRAAVTTLFYITNRYHDEMYRLGFTEQAGNFQHNNFSRGGAGADRVSAEAQDCSGVNNANFSTPSDGGRGRMQMYIWDSPTPDFDGDLDADVIIHELTHGLSNRLHGNAFGLGSNMSRGMGEGWSDFYGHAMLSEPSDDPAGIYTTGAYDTYRYRTPINTFNNYYYGIRRFPKAKLSSVGGPSNRPHNPLTLADIDATQANTSDGAFAPSTTGSTLDAVHAAGEVWSSMLWEVRAKYIARLGWANGNRRILQHVTDGMKLSPLNPTFVQARDAILAAALAGGTAEDVKDIWEGFALRGLGVSAAVTVAGTGSGTARVVEAFDLPNLQQPGITVLDSTGNNNGVAEPGEHVRISIPLRNLTGNLATSVNATLVGSGSISYGSIAHNSTVDRDFDFIVPANTCGSVVNLEINVQSSLGPITFNRQLQIGTPQTTFTESFDGVAAPAVPNGWTVTQVQSGTNFVNSTSNPDSAPNAMFALDPITVGGGSDLTSPTIPITAQAAVLTFRHRFDTEAGWDGGLLEISIGGGAYQDIVAAGGTFLENGYNGVLGVNTTGNSPHGGKSAWSGDSGGYITTQVLLPSAAAGQEIRLKWRFGADDNTSGIGPNPGWYVDNVTVAGNYLCLDAPVKDVRSDFDGDGKSDISLFRPNEGNWYVFASGSLGVFGFPWGVDGDIPVPADYDRDGKTDGAVFRPGSPSTFYVLRSKDITFTSATWGLPGDVPVVRDYDGDTVPDFGLFRPSDQTWYILENDGGIQAVNFGAPGDVPVAGDFDGDGIGDMTVYRNGQWFTRRSTGGISGVSWGLSTDMPVPADYDDDGKDDYAVFRPSDGTWWILRSKDLGYIFAPWGLNGDVPVPGDYDGDGKTDLAIYRAGEWWIAFSQGNIGSLQFGLPSDFPTPKSYIP